MALADILDAIRLETNAEIAAIRESARRQEAEISARAEEEAAAVRNEASRARTAESTNGGERIRNAARLEVDRLLRAAREGTYLEAVRRVADQLEGLRASERYRDVLAMLLREAAAVLPGADVVRIDPADLPLMENLLVELGLSGLRMEPTLHTWGGIELAAGEGRLVRNTLESRLEQAAPHLRHLASQVVRALGRAA